jgi:hypothetical protein
MPTEVTESLYLNEYQLPSQEANTYHEDRLLTPQNESGDLKERREK